MRRTTGIGVPAALALVLCAAVPAGAESAHERVGREALGGNDGWAAYGDGTTGGSAASEDSVHVVGDRAELVEALGGGNGGDQRNDTPKIIYVEGTIKGNVDAQGRELTCGDYADPEYSLDAYLSTYDPEEVPSGPLEEARQRSARNQAERVRINVGSNTTIVGLGDDARLLGVSLMLEDVDNVILRNVNFEDAYDCFPSWEPDAGGPSGTWNTEYDNVSLRGATHVWVDHSEFSDGDRLDGESPKRWGATYVMHDGLLDITNGSDLVTVSYSDFHDHGKSMLIGNTDKPTHDVGKLRVTLHHNRFANLQERAPRVRYGQVHVYNNHYVVPDEGSDAKEYVYSLGVGVESMIYAQNNYFDLGAGIEPSQVIVDWRGDDIHIEGSLVNGRSAHHRVDLLAAYNAAHEEPLGGDVGWSPELVERVHPTQSVPSRVAEHAGVGEII